MFVIKNVPIIIEPGVGALETECTVSDAKHGARTVPVHLRRLALSEKIAEQLPLVVTTRLPHVFSVTDDINKSPALVVYDSAGRIACLYTRDAAGKSWERYDIADEHSGKSVTQFSVRFMFNTSKDRNKFLTAIEALIEQVSKEETPDQEAVLTALRALSRSRAAPVLLPVAVEKCKLSKIKI